MIIKKQLVQIPRDVELPLIGLVQIGIIDRGTNLLQVRPITTCNLNCIFCSTDAGNFSKYHFTEYMIDKNYLMSWFREVAKFKGKPVHAFIDSVGDPLTYSRIIDLVQELSETREVETVAIETNGVLLTEEKIDEFAEVGLRRINLSIHALDNELSKKLTGCKWYDVHHIIEIIKYIAQSPIELTLTPVWIPSLNDKEIPKIIEFAKQINKNKKFPILGIQKYETHKYGRKPKGIRAISWWKFFRKLEEWEKHFDMKLRINPKNFGIEKRKALPIVFKKGEKVKVEIKALGWMKNEVIGVAKERCVTVVDCTTEIGKTIKIKILRNKDNLYIAKPYV
jgi:hypothetical protein